MANGIIADPVTLPPTATVARAREVMDQHNLSGVPITTDGRKLVLIVDSHPAHRATKVSRWVEARKDRVELCFMPGYSPDLNPDELLNQDTKQAMRRKRPRNQSQMIADTRSHLRRRQKQPDVVRNIFCEEHVRYAAAAG
jgi:hypothetical protein